MIWNQHRFVAGNKFNNTDTGVYVVIDKNNRQLQTEGNTSQNHNVLREEDIRKLFSSKALSNAHPKRFLVCIIPKVALFRDF